MRFKQSAALEVALMAGVDLPSGDELHRAQQEPPRHLASGLPKHLVSLMPTLKH